LYYSNDGFQSASNVAITKDGEIVANFITAGILGDKGMGSTTNWWNMDTGVMNLIGTKTSISGDCIKTGTISANRIDVNGIFAKDITASGTITGVKIKGSIISGSHYYFKGDSETDKTLGQIYLNENTNTAIIDGNSLLISGSDLVEIITMTGMVSIHGYHAGIAITSSDIEINTYNYDDNSYTSLHSLRWKDVSGIGKVLIGI
jgi:hypothetical protein